MFYYQRITPVVKTIIILNIVVFFLQQITSNLISQGFLEYNFSIHYLSILYEYKVWQIFTYMFLHGGFWHILFNMLALFFLGCEIEREWGSKHFLRYYLATGVGAGIVIFAVDSVFVFFEPNYISSLGFTLGASGAIFGILLAYSLLFSNRRITLLLFFIIPINIKAKNLLIVSLALSFLIPLLVGGGYRISNSGHLGGVAAGFLYFLIYRKQKVYFYCIYSIKQGWQNFKNLLFPVGVKPFNSDKKNNFFKKNQTFFNDKIDETKMNEVEIEEKIDELLDKISMRGLRSLTENEKKFLERVSHLYRHKFPE